MTMRESELEQELAQVYEALTNAQKRGTELINECRTLKREKERLLGAIMTLVGQAKPVSIDEVPTMIVKKLAIANEDRHNGAPDVDQRHEGYAAPPPEMRRKNGITRKKRSWK